MLTCKGMCHMLRNLSSNTGGKHETKYYINLKSAARDLRAVVLLVNRAVQL